MKKYDCTIVGAGASGMTAGIIAARRGLKVCLLEHKNEPGKKLLRTGNGKCNFTHKGVTAEDYPLRYRGITGAVFNKFGYESTISFFKELGVFPSEKNGYVYPMSGTALSVRNALVDELKRLKVDIITDVRIESVDPGFFTKALINGKMTEVESATLLMAAGSCAAPGTGSDGSGYILLEKAGVKIKKPLPALVKLLSDDRTCRRAAGVRTDGIIRLFINGELKCTESGEIQFTDDGISGIPVFQISREAAQALDENKRTETVTDLAPGITVEELKDYFKYGFINAGGRSLKNFLGGIIPGKMVTAVADKASVSADKKVCELSEEKALEIVETIKNYRLIITKTNGFDGAQVCSGGVDLAEIDFETMEHRKIKGLFFSGETVDVDGPCGGYNLQWAWSSGAVAGMNL